MSTIADDVIAFIEDQYEKRGLLQLVVAPLSFLGFLVGLGVLTGEGAAATSARVAAFAIFGVAFIALSVRTRDLTRVSRTHQKQLLDLAKRLMNSGNLDYGIQAWREEMHLGISEARITKKMTIEARKPLPVIHMISHTSDGLPQVTQAQRKKVRFTARRTGTDGTDGPRLQVVDDWLNSDHVAYIVLPEPLGEGQRFDLKCEWLWPDYPSEMGRGESGYWKWSFSNSIRSFHFSLTLDKSLGLTRPPSVHASEELGAPHVEGTSQGGWSIDVNAEEVPSSFSLTVDPA